MWHGQRLSIPETVDENYALEQMRKRLMLARFNRYNGDRKAMLRNVGSAREWFYLSRMFATLGTINFDRWAQAYARRVGVGPEMSAGF